MIHQTFFTLLQIGLKFSFDIDPLITEHLSRCAISKALRIADEATSLLRIFGNALLQVHSSGPNLPAVVPVS